jgi:HK97 family phage portal protein
MGLFDFLKRQPKVVEKIVEKKQELHDLLSFPNYNFGQPPSRKATEYLKEYKEWIYANINVVAESTSDIDFELYRLKKGGDVEEIQESELLELLYRFNSFTSKHDAVFLWCAHMYLMGEHAWYLVRSTDNPDSLPEEIYPLRTDYMKVIPGDLAKGEFIKYYKYEVPGKEPLTFLPHEILFFKNPDPENPYRGIGIVKASALSIDTDKFATNWNRNFFYNSARPDAVLTTEQKLHDDQYKRLVSKWNSKFGGYGKMGQTAILEAGLDYKIIQQTAKDMDFLEQQRWSRDKIMAMFRNTKVALGITDDVNRANAEASEYVHAKNVVRPMMQKLVDFLNEFLVPLYGDDLFLSFKNPVPESVELKLNEYEKGLNKWLTINEVRQKEGLEDVEGGDVIYLPFNLSPIGAEKQEVPIKELPVIKGNILKLKFRDEIRKLRNRNIRRKKLMVQKKELNNKLKETIRDLLKKNHKKKRNNKNLVLDKNSSRYKRWVEWLRIAEGYQPKIEKIFKEKIVPKMEQEIIKNYTGQKDLGGIMFDQDQMAQEINEETEGLLSDLVTTVGLMFFTHVGASGKYNPQATAYLQNKMRMMSTSISNTGYEVYRKEILRGLNLGEQPRQILARIKKVSGDLRTWHAKRIARTESLRMSNAGMKDAIRQAGYKHFKWVTTSTACSLCSYMGIHYNKVDISSSILGEGEEVIYFDEKEKKHSFKQSFGNLEEPPIHPNCNCSIQEV